MPDLTKRGFKKPLENEAYDIKIINFNTDKLEEELDKKADLVEGKIKSNQLPEMDYAPINHSHTTINGYAVESNVPSNAKFTDTVYTHPTTHPASMITGLPTSLPASDVPAWAKASTKPTYTASEIGAAPASHASTGSTHGLGSNANYGHVKLYNGLDRASYVDGEALPSNIGKVLSDKINADVAGIFKTGDVRTSTHDLSNLGYIKNSEKELLGTSYPTLRDKIKYWYGGVIKTLTWRNNPIGNNTTVYLSRVFSANNVLFYLLSTPSNTHTMYYSTDGGVTLNAIATSIGNNISNVYQVYYFNNRYVMHTMDSILTSTSLSSFATVYTSPASSYICSIGFINGNYIMTMYGNSSEGFYYSTDLSVWTRALNTTADWRIDSYASRVPILVSGKNLVMTCWRYNGSGTNYYYTTTDGTSWTKRTPSAGLVMATSCEEYNSIYIPTLDIFILASAFNSSSVKYTKDGINFYDCTSNGGIRGDRASLLINVPAFFSYDSVTGLITCSTQNGHNFVSIDGINFSFIATPNTINGYNIPNTIALSIVGGKTCLAFRYVYSGESNYTIAFGTGNFGNAGIEYFSLPYDKCADTWTKL